MNRTNLKESAKVAFKANYGRCVLAGILISFTVGSLIHGALDSSSSSSSQTLTMHASNSSLLGWFAGMSLLAFVIVVLIRVLLLQPLYAGCQNFFLVNAQSHAEYSEMASGYKRNYQNTVFTMFLTFLFQFLWSLLLVIPGLIKHYSYRFVPYILAENPDMPAREIIDQSRKMMDGHKWEAFILDLSFILWWLLAFVTIGLAGIFWTAPYHFQTNAKYYLEVKNSIKQ